MHTSYVFTYEHPGPSDIYVYSLRNREVNYREETAYIQGLTDLDSL